MEGLKPSDLFSLSSSKVKLSYNHHRHISLTDLITYTRSIIDEHLKRSRNIMYLIIWF